MTATLAIPGRIFTIERPENTASSKVHSVLDKFEEKLSAELSSSVTWQRNPQLVQELHEIYSECSVENWDGYGALPLNEQAVREAKCFIDIMPISMPEPEIVPEPNGDIGFQWSFGRNRILTVSFNGKKTLTYASILGSPNKTKYGSEIFYDCIPEEVVEGIGEIRS